MDKFARFSEQQELLGIGLGNGNGNQVVNPHIVNQNFLACSFTNSLRDFLDCEESDFVEFVAKSPQIIDVNLGFLRFLILLQSVEDIALLVYLEDFDAPLELLADEWEKQTLNDRLVGELFTDESRGEVLGEKFLQHVLKAIL